MDRKHPLFELAQSWLPVLTAVAGGLWGLFVYIDHQKELQSQNRQQAERESVTRLIEAQRPFLNKQLELYFETAGIAGKLVTLPVDSEKWKELEQRYWALYWSELSMVEDTAVEEAMVQFGKVLNQYESNHSASTRAKFEQATYELAHAIRDSIRASWSTRR